MTDSYTINVNISSEELEEMLYEDKGFEWFFTPTLDTRKGESDKSLVIKVLLNKDREYEIPK